MTLPLTSCNPWVIQTLPTELTFRQRVCLGLAHLASPLTFADIAAISAYHQLRNVAPSINPRDAEDYGSRIGYGYERQTARATAELLAGYLHNEDPRPHPSNSHGAWKRTRCAILSVLESPGPDGNERVALLPIAGALGSGLTTMALFPHQNGWSNGLERSGIAYGFYFGRAVAHEFSPELWLLAPQFVRKHRAGVTKAVTL